LTADEYLAPYFSTKTAMACCGARLGIMNVTQIRLDGRDQHLEKLVHHIADLVKPAAQMARAGEDLVQDLPEA